MQCVISYWNNDIFSRMSNVNDSFFEGHYKTIWKEITPPILTEREILFIKKYFQLNENSLILDLMCGYGRHAVGLAEIGRGLRKTSFDMSSVVLSSAINFKIRISFSENLTGFG